MCSHKRMRPRLCPSLAWSEKRIRVQSLALRVVVFVGSSWLPADIAMLVLEMRSSWMLKVPEGLGGVWGKAVLAFIWAAQDGHAWEKRLSRDCKSTWRRKKRVQHKTYNNNSKHINTSNWRLIAAFFESDVREGNCRFLNTKSKIWIKMDQTKYIMWVKQ